MPTYEYLCNTCNHAFEIRQKFTEDALTVCPACSQETLRKVIHATGIVFKGSGFYKTDSQDRSKKTTTEKDANTPPATTPTSQTPPTPSKSSDSPAPSSTPETSTSATPSSSSSSSDKASK